MKFLCVPCDNPMKILTVSPPDRGSISVVYSCDACGYEMAMLTNAFETQMVSSLGVKVGPASASEPAGAEAQAPRCPFAGMVAGATEAAVEPAGIRWTAEAEARMESVPSFVRPMARSGIEKFAEENGYREIDAKVLDEARSRFGM
jgi:Proto-chlorophyllide reductase 57 kD subunit